MVHKVLPPISRDRVKLPPINGHDRDQNQPYLRGGRVEALHPELWIEIFLNNTETDFRWDIAPDISSAAENGPEANRHQYLRPYVDPSRPTRTASHVCRYWRGIVLSAPKIWSRFIDCDLLPQAWFKEVLHRAQDVPLTVVCRCVDSPTDEAQTYAIQRTNPNIGQLLASKKEFGEFYAHLGMYLLSHIAARLIQRLQQPMPQLTTFYLDVAQQRFGEMLWDIYDRDIVNLFANKAPPLLRKFSLRDYPLQASYSFLHSLTYLSITDPPHYFPLLAMLGQTPHLQQLILELFSPHEHMSPMSGGTAFGPTNRVKLPCLTQIRLLGHYQAIVTLLECLDPAELLVLSCEVDSILPGNISNSTETFRRLLGPKAKSKTPLSGGMVFVLLWRFYTTITITSPQGHLFYLSIANAPWFTSRDYATILQNYSALFASCPFLLIGYAEPRESFPYRRPDVSTFNTFQNKILIEFIRIFNHVGTVAIKGMSISLMVELLGADDTSLPSLGRVVMPCSADSLCELGAFDEIADLLQKRSSAGRPLQYLTFQASQGGNPPCGQKVTFYELRSF
ncbi:hypothetical protein HYPSUDRAFT_74092 [Hypholoma sublateritium FD-334 SS-4]|uniref:F-box domain-containing protein n=1 Tax=Hypholoma sublateritium (strain FD-334 SS-4) TaxID=945553 RepID=A0A0D2QB92_HYPSF|nr:hypothetical protein HYPSUDRAFT_74092 [Hypholoma sublateritium FD-334 SS-4]